MAFKIFVSELAKLNISDGMHWYESRQEGLGTKFFDAISDTMDYIIYNPYLFPLKNYGFRESVIAGFPYMIIYKVIDNTIYITSIFNTHKNPGKKPNK